MCGIAGFWTPSFAEALARPILERMTSTMRNRGPDADGIWLDGRCGIALGHRRLAVVELSALGHQPMASADERYQLLFNGEIYNFRTLRAVLEGEGVRFRGSSDTEVLLALIVRDGLAKALSQCVGMFAVALWDCREHTLQLARDRFGEKPLYVARVPGGLVFASTLAPIEQHPAFTPTINREALAAFLCNGYVPAPHSIFRDVVKVMPGSILTWSRSPAQPPTAESFWSAGAAAAEGAAEPFVGSDVDAADALDQALRRAVSEQMLADVPLGAFLSGGVDSSLIVAIMQQLGTRPARTFTIGFDDPAFDEAHHASAVAKQLGTDHTTLVLTARAALDIIPQLATIYDEPFADQSQIPTIAIAALAREHVTVALSGDGGDELFGGYRRYAFVERAWRRRSYAPRSVRQLAGRALAAVHAHAWDTMLGVGGSRLAATTGDRLRKFAVLLGSESAEHFYRDMLCSWMNPAEVIPSLRDTPNENELREHVPPGGFLGSMMLCDQQSYLPDDVLVKVDRATMASSLESRSPFLDHRIAELAWRFNRDQWQRNGRGKHVVRAVLDRYVPRALIDRPKQGFGVPISSWLRGPLRPWAEELLSVRALEQDGLLTAAPIRRRWQQHLSEQRDWSTSLWHVLMFQAWRTSHSTQVP